MATITWILLVSVLCHMAASRTSPVRWATRSRYVLPWLKGPNMCAYEDVNGSRKQYYSKCLKYGREICGKKTTIRFHCCNGFERTEEGERGCLGVKPVHNLMRTIHHLAVFEFEKYVKASGLDSKFKDSGPYTIFVPDRLVYYDLPDETKMLLGTTDQSKNLIRMHVAEGRFFNKDLHTGLEIPSIYYYQDKGILKFRKYGNGVKTVNCVRLTETDHVATNGIIHFTEKVIEPYPNRGNIIDIIMQDDRFGELMTALIVSDLANELRDESATFTLLAPTDEVFQRAPRELINRILADKELVKKLLLYHQLPNDLCSAAILGPYRVRSREGQVLNLTCNIDDTITVNGVPIYETDIVASNGVIHVIDELLIPDSIKSIGDIIGEMNMGKFTEYAQQAGMQAILSGEAPGNYTVFVPRPEAFDALSEDDMMRLRTDTAFVKETLKYHVVPEVLTTYDMNEGQVMETLYKAPLKAHVYQNGYGVNSAKIVSPNHEASNGIIHVIDRVMFPPVSSAMDIIKQDPRLTTLNSLLEVSGLDKELEDSEHVTLFAPSNSAFSRLPREQIELLTNDEQQLKQALNYHVMPKQVFTSGISKGLKYRYNTLAKESLTMKKQRKGDPVKVNDDAVIIEPDIETTSGAVHIIDRVLQCPCVIGFQNDGQSGGGN